MAVTGSNSEQPQFIASAGNRSFSSNAPLIENSDARIVVPDNKFFGDQPGIDVLTKKQNALLGVATNDDGKQVVEDARYPPWVQCFLKSHYLDKYDICGSQQYRIFGTRLVVIRIDTHCLVC
ncbi:uncharacterized protein LOC133825506 [Humulus lupulus]|uniref:uncharacterized protein LOC133825506 n=1 Tax=Humulus lupulus TaxID=3486 RepID=UPI002B414F1C|nr:uncharacterized protein LOC133825506 [Humulus lupulus]